MSKKKKHPQVHEPSNPNFSEGRYGSPPKAPVERLPVLGTTWYTRGASYWLRRVAIFFVVLFAAACQVFFVGIIFSVIANDSSKTPTFRVVALTIVGICVIASLVYWTRWFIRVEGRKRRGELAYPDYVPRTSESGALAGGMGAMARSGDSAAGGCVFAAAVLTAGATPYLIVRTLQKEYVYEHDARLRLEKWKRDHNDISSTPQ